MAIHDNVDEWRLQFVSACAQYSVHSAISLGVTVDLHSDEQVFKAFVEKYRVVRQQFAAYHDIAPQNLLMNYKAAAILVHQLSLYEAEAFFKFPIPVAESTKRLLMATFKQRIVHVLCFLRDPITDSEIELFEDLEYCLTEEVPENIEVLCLALHALCLSLGEKTTVEKH